MGHLCFDDPIYIGEKIHKKVQIYQNCTFINQIKEKDRKNK